MLLIDAHVHLDGYGQTIDVALKQIVEQNIFSIGNSMDLPSWERNLEIGRRCGLVLPTFGVHPWHAAFYADRLKDIEAAVDETPMIGEIGLDYHWVKVSSQYPAQRRVFEFFLAAAKKQEKVVNLHTKGAEREVCDLLNRFEIERAIVHWYSGPLNVLSDLISMGCYFTVGVDVLYSEHVRQIACGLPSELLLTETDNPGGIRWRTGEPGMPVHLMKVIAELADLRQTTSEEIVRVVYENFTRLIKDDPWLEDIRLQILP